MTNLFANNGYTTFRRLAYSGMTFGSKTMTFRRITMKTNDIQEISNL